MHGETRALDLDALANHMRSLRQAHVPPPITPGVPSRFLLDDLWQGTQTFQDLGVWSPGETATVTGQGHPEQVRTLTASQGVLTTLGVAPEIGRWFSKADDTPGAPDTVMLGHGYWHRRFGGDRAVLERVHHQCASSPDHRRDAGGVPF
jgi:hypothetical protein